MKLKTCSLLFLMLIFSLELICVAPASANLDEVPDGCTYSETATPVLTPAQEDTPDWVWPLNAPITDTFKIRTGVEPHLGLDLGGWYGTIIHAMAKGKVIYAGNGGTFGKLIMVSHGGEYTSYYAHCSKIYVKIGQDVKAGEAIGEVGDTGHAFGPHLHMEIHHFGVAVDPLACIKEHLPI